MKNEKSTKDLFKNALKNNMGKLVSGTIFVVLGLVIKYFDLPDFLTFF